MSDIDPLSVELIAFFKTHGYLILNDFIDKSTLKDWRRQIWTALASSPERPDTWPQKTQAVDGFQYAPPESAFGQYPALSSIIEQMGGGSFAGGGGTPIIAWPQLDTVWSPPRDGHIDAYGPGGWSPFLIGATTYLYDVEPHGGGFIFWPDSHHTAHRYFLQNPEQVDGSFRDIDGWGWHVFREGAARDPIEFTATAGSVVLWHSYLSHGGSMNVNSTPRCALFARWTHLRRNEQAFRYETPEDLWKYWAI